MKNIRAKIAVERQILKDRIVALKEELYKEDDSFLKAIIEQEISHTEKFIIVLSRLYELA